MPVNRNALIRCRTIDNCLRHKYKKWTLEDLIEACSDALYELIEDLRSKGFDATSKASSLIKLSRLPNQNTSCEDLRLENLVYLPMFPTMKAKDKSRLLKIINRRA